MFRNRFLIQKPLKQSKSIKTSKYLPKTIVNAMKIYPKFDKTPRKRHKFRKNFLFRKRLEIDAQIYKFNTKMIKTVKNR